MSQTTSQVSVPVEASTPAAANTKPKFCMKKALWAAGSGLIGGVLALLPIAVLLPVFFIPKKMEGWNPPLPKAKQDQVDAAIDKASCENSMLGMAFIGLGIPLLMTLVGPRIAVGNPTTVKKVALWLSGLLVATLATVAGAWLADYLRGSLRHVAGVDELQRSVATQVVMLILTGIGIGGGLALASRRDKKDVLQFILAGALAGGMTGFLYPVLVGFVMVRTDTDVLIPKDIPAQVLWLGILCVLFGLFFTRIHRTAAANSAIPDEAGCRAT